MSREPEDRVEMICTEDTLDNIVKAVRSVHPYETPAIDVYNVEVLS